MSTAPLSIRLPERTVLGTMRRSGIALACVLLVALVATSSAYASGGFGIERYGLTATGEGGAPDTQAGSHPHALTLETVLAPGTGSHEVKSLAFELPPGLIVDPRAVPQAGAIGEVQMMAAGKSISATVYNLVPAPGEFGRFGFTLEGVQVIAEVSVRPGSDYGMTLSIQDIPRVEGEVESVKLTLGGAGPSTLLRLPTSCASSSQTTLQGESWGEETASLSAAVSQMTGCNSLVFNPSLSIAPDVDEAATPSGYEVDVDVPQPEDPEGLASADLYDANITLPEGVGISLSAADGLQACTEAQVGLGSQAAVMCPNASKIGTVAIHTPLLANPLQGAVYLATPDENPSGSPLAIYIVAEDPISGVRVKLAGEIEANPSTGQLTIVLRELPQLPISAFEVHFFGGARALLSTPPACGLATSTSALEPWSGTPAAAPSSSFEIDAGIDGTACSAAQPFDPMFQATSTTAGQADTYGSLSLLVSRTASEQQLGAISIQAPPAVAQLLAGVPACGEPQASEGACPQASEVGTVAAQAGLGSYPADLNGAIYLTGPPSAGTRSGPAAQGLEIVLPVEPGPLRLGEVVVRASMQIELGTGRLRIATGPLPSLADGVPLQLKALLLQLDRGGLQINPEGCESIVVTGTITGAQGSSATIASEPFGASSSPCPLPAFILPGRTSGTGRVPSPTGGVSLAHARIATTKGGRAALELSCSATPRCRGKLALTVRTRGMFEKHGSNGTGGTRRSKKVTIGTANFSIPAGKTTIVELQLNSLGRAFLSPAHGRLAATLSILKSSPDPAQTHLDSVYLVWQGPRGGRKGASPSPRV